MKNKVILVDDDDILRDLTKDMINLYDVEVFSAADLDEAVKLFKRHHQEIKIAILDLNLDYSDGFEVLSEFKKISEDFIPVLASGMVTDYEIDDYKEKGFIEVIQKPYRIQILQNLIDTYIKN